LSGPVVYEGSLAGEAVKGSDSEADHEQREIVAHSFLHRIQRERAKILSNHQAGLSPLELALRRVAALGRYESRVFADRKLALKIRREPG
jgi:hypothetical protein